MPLRRALLLIALQALLVFVLGFGVIGRLVLPDPEQPFAPSWALVALILGAASIGGVGLVWLASVRGTGRTWGQVGWRLDGWPRQVGLGLLGAAACLALEVLVLAAAGQTPGETLAGMAAPGAAQRGVFLLIGAWP